MPHSVLSLQAEGEALRTAIKLLGRVIYCSPPYSVTAAIDANIIPGLVRALRELRPPPQPSGETPPVLCSDLQAAMTCLSQVMHHEIDHPTGLWKAAFDAGLVPVLCNMLRLGDQAMRSNLLTLSNNLMLITPADLQGLEGRWAKELPRTLAGLIASNPHAAPAAAVKTLLNMCLVHKEVLLESHKWYLGDSLKQLSTHGNSETAAVAKQLLSLVEQAFKVRSNIRSQNSQSVPFMLIYSFSKCGARVHPPNDNASIVFAWTCDTAYTLTMDSKDRTNLCSAILC
jgi:hypothetical protein